MKIHQNTFHLPCALSFINTLMRPLHGVLLSPLVYAFLISLVIAKHLICGKADKASLMSRRRLMWWFTGVCANINVYDSAENMKTQLWHIAYNDGGQPQYHWHPSFVLFKCRGKSVMFLYEYCAYISVLYLLHNIYTVFFLNHYTDAFSLEYRFRHPALELACHGEMWISMWVNYGWLWSTCRLQS